MCHISAGTDSKIRYTYKNQSALSLIRKLYTYWVQNTQNEKIYPMGKVKNVGLEGDLYSNRTQTWSSVNAELG